MRYRHLALTPKTGTHSNDGQDLIDSALKSTQNEIGPSIVIFRIYLESKCSIFVLFLGVRAVAWQRMASFRRQAGEEALIMLAFIYIVIYNIFILLKAHGMANVIIPR